MFCLETVKLHINYDHIHSSRFELLTMPGQVRKTRHSCKNMSETSLQQETKFPQRRATGAVSSPAVERKSYSLRSPAPITKNLVENDCQVVLEVLPYFIIKRYSENLTPIILFRLHSGRFCCIIV